MDLELNEWFQPASLETDYSDKDKDRILGFIITLGSSFPSEISRRLLMDLPKVNAILIQMQNNGFILRMVPEELYPQALIKCRIAEMWGQGVWGYKEFALRSWFIATLKGFWHYTNKFQGEHRRANHAYIQTYPELEDWYKEFPGDDIDIQPKPIKFSLDPDIWINKPSKGTEWVRRRLDELNAAKSP